MAAQLIRKLEGQSSTPQLVVAHLSGLLVPGLYFHVGTSREFIWVCPLRSMLSSTTSTVPRPGNSASADNVLAWLARLHFGRFPSLTLEITWTVFGLVPGGSADYRRADVVEPRARTVVSSQPGRKERRARILGLASRKLSRGLQLSPHIRFLSECRLNRLPFILQRFVALSGRRSGRLRLLRSVDAGE